MSNLLSTHAFWIIAALLAGVVLGLVHFRSLRWMTGAFARGQAARAMLVQLVRMGLVVLCLLVAVRGGALTLLAMALGIFIGRAVILRREKREDG